MKFEHDMLEFHGQSSTTRAQQILPCDSTKCFHLQYPPQAQRLGQGQATQTLGPLVGLIAIDQVQLRPGLFQATLAYVSRCRINRAV